MLGVGRKNSEVLGDVRCRGRLREKDMSLVSRLWSGRCNYLSMRGLSCLASSSRGRLMLSAVKVT